MVRQLILPKEGGGPWRRFAGIWGKLYRDKWNDSRPFRGPVPLFDLRRSDDAADVREISRQTRIRGLYPGWRVSDDSVIGGFSSSKIELKEPDSGPPYVRWRGNLSTKVDHQSNLARNVTRSGFASVMTPEIPLSAPLENRYQALEICCRTDGRTYAVNLHCETYFPDGKDLASAFFTTISFAAGTNEVLQTAKIFIKASSPGATKQMQRDCQTSRI